MCKIKPLGLRQRQKYAKDGDMIEITPLEEGSAYDSLEQCSWYIAGTLPEVRSTEFQRRRQPDARERACASNLEQIQGLAPS